MANLAKILKQAQGLQQKMAAVQEEAAARDFEGTSGGKLVSVVVMGGKQVKAVSIDSSLLKLEEKEVLEDLLVAAFNDAQNKFANYYESVVNSATAGVSLPGGLPF